jgi:hypothetical protein
MHTIDLKIVTEDFDQSVKGKMCINAWLGYGHPLFLDFDDKPLPLDEPERKSRITVEVAFGDWWIELDSHVIGRSTQPRSEAEAIAQLLVGRRLIDWQLDGSDVALTLLFEGGYCLKMSRYSHGDTSKNIAWKYRLPDGYYRFVRWDGVAYLIHKDEPVTQFPDLLIYLFVILGTTAPKWTDH